MSVQFIKGPGAADAASFKKQYTPNNYLVTAHPLPRKHSSLFMCEGSDVICIMKGHVNVEAGGQTFEMKVSDQLKMEGVKQFSVTVLSDVGTFFLKASKKVESMARAG